MTTISSFINRLNKLDIKVELVSNFPWIYLDKVCGKKVKGKLHSNHGFTCFFQAIRPNEQEKITDISIIFKKIRETLQQ